MIGGRRPAPGPQAGRPAGPRRAAARALLPLHRQRPADGQGGGQRADDRDRAGDGAASGRSSSGARWPARTSSASGCPRRRRSRSSAPTRSLVGLRDRGDPAGPDPRRRRRAGVRPRDQHRHLGPARSRSPSAIARSASPTRRAAARTPSRRRTSGGRVSLIAASALLIDYVMTVAVSTSSAVEQITSAFPVLFDERVADRRRRDRPHHDRQPARPARGRATSSRSRPTCSSARRC